MRNRLIKALTLRLQTEIALQNPIIFLSTLSVEQMVDAATTVLYLYSRPSKSHEKKSVLFSEIISAIGHSVRGKNRLPKDSALAAKAGSFILYTFDTLRIVTMKLSSGANGHGAYIVEVVREDILTKLWEGLSTRKMEKLPSTEPYEPWVSWKHATGIPMIKTTNKEVLEQIDPETHWMLFETLNRAQSVGWRINEDVFKLVNWALRNKAEAFADIWEIQNEEAKRSKIREANAVSGIAKRYLDKIFYHLYYYDFRGRKYPATAYLHEQGSDLAKGLLLRADVKPIGKDGFDWLLISIANNWAGDAGRPDGLKTDKIPLRDRVEWAIDNEEILLDYAESPKVNQGWMQADKPWQFLAACNELMRLRIWQMGHSLEISIGELHEYDYPSSLECYIDGSNNGSQHLSALTRDEITAPHVNLVPLDLPGDLYKYVADHVWLKIDEQVAAMPASEFRECEAMIEHLKLIKMQIINAPLKSELRKELIDELRGLRSKSADLVAKSAVVFWHKIKDPKQRRKVVKRNVMTLPYGGTAYGLGQQQIDDARKHGIESLMTMEHKWGSYMGRMVFEDCRESLKRPMRLLSLFEAAGKAAEAEGRFLGWQVPVTNFPVIQNYTEGTVKKIYVSYGPPVGPRNSSGYRDNAYQISICFVEELKMARGKQAQGASPNAIHSLDAAHLMLATVRCDFPVTTIHDSFGCLLADMPKLFVAIRETFVELYATDPLPYLLTQIGADIRRVETGSLDLNLVLESEYCFA